MLKNAQAGTFCVENPPSRAITRAAERYLEQYGDPLVMNTYLKVTILVLAAICSDARRTRVPQPKGSGKHSSAGCAHRRRWPR